MSNRRQSDGLCDLGTNYDNLRHTTTEKYDTNGKGSYCRFGDDNKMKDKYVLSDDWIYQDLFTTVEYPFPISVSNCQNTWVYWTDQNNIFHFIILFHYLYFSMITSHHMITVY